MSVCRVVCSNSECKKGIALWGEGYRYQKEEEWECNGGKRVKVGRRKLYKSNGLEMKYQRVSCDKVFCGKCARKLRYKCNRPGCKGRLRLTMHKDGSMPKSCRQA